MEVLLFSTSVLIDYRNATKVSNITNIVAIAGISDTGYALDSSGHVWSWGYGQQGQLGNGTTTASQLTPVQVSNISNIIAIAGGTSFYALDSSGKVWAWGDNTSGQLGNGTYTTALTPVQVSNISGIVSIAGGYLAGYALNSSGQIWSWGKNNIAQLGTGTTNDSNIPVQVLQSGWTVPLP
ncbi:RCC1 domain-containing protein, alpha-tubulin suppressor (fragment) [Candidatus Desulfosporosinus infrequens]|uniref:RCC1 domain-containing protein, alpha-tubulin suppressor n=1 Tax=Candidatus Desulfosporosinus infrequens TaxID=2043169 RepID=A0A2U3KI00_9FIRM